MILSAGAIGSPQILLLSGIGPRKELEKHQIPVLVDLPGVGQHLQDHLCTLVFCLTEIPSLSESDVTPENLQRWKTEGKGLLASCGGEMTSWFQVNGSGEFT